MTPTINLDRRRAWRPEGNRNPAPAGGVGPTSKPCATGSRTRTQLLAAHGWPEAAEKACYLLKLLATTPIAQDPRRQKLIANVVQDFERLRRSDAGDGGD
jgi:hypothetical protein